MDTTCFGLTIYVYFQLPSTPTEKDRKGQSRSASSNVIQAEIQINVEFENKSIQFCHKLFSLLLLTFPLSNNTIQNKDSSIFCTRNEVTHNQLLKHILILLPLNESSVVAIAKGLKANLERFLYLIQILNSPLGIDKFYYVVFFFPREQCS